MRALSAVSDSVSGDLRPKPTHVSLAGYAALMFWGACHTNTKADTGV